MEQLKVDDIVETVGLWFYARLKVITLNEHGYNMYEIVDSDNPHYRIGKVQGFNNNVVRKITSYKIGDVVSYLGIVIRVTEITSNGQMNGKILDKEGNIANFYEIGEIYKGAEFKNWKFIRHEATNETTISTPTTVQTNFKSGDLLVAEIDGQTIIVLQTANDKRGIVLKSTSKQWPVGNFLEVTGHFELCNAKIKIQLD
jgi:hypothetical protein